MEGAEEGKEEGGQIMDRRERGRRGGGDGIGREGKGKEGQTSTLRPLI